MEFSLTTLGTASALPTANRYPSAHILTVRERLFLIDCGEGAQMQMRKAGISIGKIDNIFISHLHGDHVFGLFGLLSTFSMMGRTAPLYIHAPYRMESMLSFFKEQFAEGLKYEIVHVPVKCKGFEKILDIGGVEVFAFPLKHRGETYGYLFREKMPVRNIHKHLIEPYKLSLYEIARLKEGTDVVRNATLVDDDGVEIPYEEVLKWEDFTYQPYSPRSFAYCSDTAPFEQLHQWVEGVDLLYHEGTFGDELKEMAAATLHSTVTDAAGCARRAGVGKLVIGHYSSRYKNTDELLVQARQIFENTFSAKEGAIFDVPLNKYK